VDAAARVGERRDAGRGDFKAGEQARHRELLKSTTRPPRRRALCFNRFVER
jgi:hypothetical protein